jgi:hypothetical protein
MPVQSSRLRKTRVALILAAKRGTSSRGVGKCAKGTRGSLEIVLRISATDNAGNAM